MIAHQFTIGPALTRNDAKRIAGERGAMECSGAPSLNPLSLCRPTEHWVLRQNPYREAPPATEQNR